jgi:hypothetical protein
VENVQNCDSYNGKRYFYSPQTPIQRVLGPQSPGREAVHSVPSSTEIKNDGATHPLLHTTP